MSEEQDTEEEPSIEEILDSIRQIISDDEEEGAEEQAEEEPVQSEEEPPPPAEPEPDSAPPEEDVVELTEKVDDTPEPDPGPETVEVDIPDEPEEEVIQVDMKDVAQDDPAPEPARKVEASVDDDFDKLLTDHAENATMEGFSDLAKKAAVERGGNVTVEDIVREEIRPMLRVWLDKNLPSIVERLVEKELRRISSEVRDD